MIAIAFLLRKCMLTAETETADTLERVLHLSAERYTPMLRLTDEADFRFLAAQPGFRPEMAARLRNHRYRLLQAYLRSLRSDFESVATALKYVLANANCDRPHLASLLLRSQAAFQWSFLLASTRAWAWHKGLGNVDPRKLLNAFDALQVELRQMAPHASAA